MSAARAPRRDGTPGRRPAAARRSVLLVLAVILAGCGGRDSASRGEAEPAPAKVRASRRAWAASLDVPPVTPTLAAGNPVHGDLPPAGAQNPPGALWSLAARGGDLVVATLRSTEFDPYLVLADSAGGRLRLLEEDDDSGGGTDARIQLEIPDGGRVFLIASAGAPGGGAYDLSLSVDPMPVFETGGDPSDRYALLVGIGDYPGWENDLPGVATDLNMMHEMLAGTFGIPEANILVLRDKQATRHRIMNAFLEHLGHAGPDGAAIFYYSGHGVRLETNTFLTPPLDVEADGRDEALYLGDGNVLLDEEVGLLADQLRSQRVLLVLDSCYSGTGSRAPGVWLKRVSETSDRIRTDGLPGAPAATAGNDRAPGGDEFAPDPGRHVLLAAAAEDERAGVLSGLPGLAPSDTASVFTYHLTRVLEAAKGSISFAALTDSIRARTRATRALSDVTEQTPGMLGKSAEKSVSDFLSRRRR